MADQHITLVANGDLRAGANTQCWPAQVEVETAVTKAIEAEGWRVQRAHPYDSERRHGFILSQRHGIEVFRGIDPEQPLVIAFAAWQYSQHLLPGLMSHRAPILTVANWSGQWPGLVGMLNMNASLTKADVSYSTLWSEDFTDEWFKKGLATWLRTGTVAHDARHVRSLDSVTLPTAAEELGRQLGRRIRREKALLGVFDEGCMGMYNAIVPDHLLNRLGLFKERLSQSTLYYEALQVRDEEAQACREWLNERGMTFRTGSNPEEELTDDQILLQLKTYIAALRLADDFGCDAVGIQYQQGLKELLPASDLAEGLLNNTERPPAFSREGKRELYAGRALPHFNEADEGAGIDALITHRIWTALGYAPETTLHDLRWGAPYGKDYVWVLEISGAVPPAHLGGYQYAESLRQPPMFFPAGGGTIKGYCKPGEIVWSRVFIEEGRLKADLGRGRAVELPDEEAERRSKTTTPEWPIMHAITYGVTRDQMMARHKSNHLQVAYAPGSEEADHALAVKAAMLQEMGIDVYLCGEVGDAIQGGGERYETAHVSE